MLHVANEKQEPERPFVSVVVPAHNEASILTKNLEAICAYLRSIQNDYCWELILVNDGSTDETGTLADAFAKSTSNVIVLHHPSNFGLGQALRYGFNQCRGDYIVALDLDLSYAPKHIAELLGVMRRTGAKVVVASPYMKGGTIGNVPWFRRVLSVWANKFLSFAAKGSLSTLTGMVRAYDARFLRAMSLRSMAYDINPEIIHKTMLLSGKIEESPAHLDWHLQRSAGVARRSSMRVLAQMMSVLLSGFLFRPVFFFILPGMALLLFSLYVGIWVLIHFLEHWPSFSNETWLLDRASAALAASFSQYPHTLVVAGLSLILSIQLLGLGILALQNKSYFEEIFRLGTSLRAFQRTGDNDSQKKSAKKDPGTEP